MDLPPLVIFSLLFVSLSLVTAEHQKLDLKSAEVSLMKSQMKLPRQSEKREKTNDYGEVEEQEAHTTVQQEDGREEVGEYVEMEEHDAHTPLQPEECCFLVVYDDIK